MCCHVEIWEVGNTDFLWHDLLLHVGGQFDGLGNIGGLSAFIATYSSIPLPKGDGRDGGSIVNFRSAPSPWFKGEGRDGG
jgi:hypothetical protein